MNETRFDETEVMRENRRLRVTLETLLDELEDGTPVDTARVREKMPDTPGEKNPIEPPWVREGYESKGEWQRDRKE